MASWRLRRLRRETPKTNKTVPGFNDVVSSKFSEAGWSTSPRLTILHLLVWSQFPEVGCCERSLHLSCQGTIFLSVIYPLFNNLCPLPLKFLVIFAKFQYFLTILIFLCYALFLDNQRGCGGIGIRARLRCVWLCLASSSLAIRIF